MTCVGPTQITLSETELKGLLKIAFNQLAQSKPDRYQRRNALASIENIQRELGMRC
jgi:hypothetical protein